SVVDRADDICVSGIDCQQHAASSTVRREYFARRDMPILARIVEQELPARVEIEKTPFHGRTLQVDPNGRAARRRAVREPSCADWGEPFCAPPVIPGLEIAGELLEHDR